MPDTFFQSEQPPGTGIFYGYVIVAVSALSLALVFSVHYAFGVFFKPLSAAFGWTRATTAGPFSLVWIVQGMLSIVMGAFNDKFGPRMVLSICAVLVGAGYVLTSQIQSVWQVYLFYGVLVGGGLGGIFVPLTSTTARWFAKRRGAMTGIVTSGIGVGALAGPLIANWLIAHYNWRISYMVLGAVVFCGVLAAAQFLRRDPAQMGTQPFGAGQNDMGKNGAMTSGLSLREAVSTMQFWLAIIVFFCYGFSWTAILIHLAPHATDLGYTAGRAASVLAVMGGVSIVGKIVMGAAADRVGNKCVYIVCFAAMIASLVWLMSISSLWGLYMFAIVFGMAYGGLAAAHSPIVAWLFGIRKHGLIFGVCFNGWTLGCAFGPIIAGYIYDVTNSYRSAFMICCLLCSIALLLMFPLKPALLEAPAQNPQNTCEAAH